MIFKIVTLATAISGKKALAAVVNFQKLTMATADLGGKN
jgi:hypothetical protein